MAGAALRGCSMLSKILNDKCRDRLISGCGPYQLICLVDDILLVWSREDVCLYACILDPGQHTIVQTLALSRPPVWEVERVLLNKTESCLMLVGRRGVAIVDLPQRCGSPPLFDMGRETITCRVEYLADRFFSCHAKLDVIDVAWHPGSPDNNHIVLLTSDNYLRIYNTSSLEVPEQALIVGAVQSGVVPSCMLGQSPVSFTFGLPTEALKSSSGNPVSNGIISNLIDGGEEMAMLHRGLLWPVFLLFGSGDIYYIITSLTSSKPWKHTLQGPVNMTPGTLDNYGLDFCDVLVLPSSPPVLVLATTSGHLHHCVLIHPNTNPEELEDSIPGNETAVKLYVYESVELELTFLPEEENFTSALLLHHDPSSPTRYWVSHDAGIHTVTLPLVENFLQFSKTTEEVDFPEAESECIVEHLVCTRSVAGGDGIPVMGLVPGPANTILGFLASGKIITITLPPALQPQVSQPRSLPSHHPVSPLRKVHSENFESHIRSDLQRCRSQPVLASGSNTTVGAAEYLNLVNRVMETLRTGYINPQRAAALQIERRSDILREQKQRLKCEIDDLLTQKEELGNKAPELAEKYEEANDRKNQLIERLERVLSQLMRSKPFLSSGEKNMSRELDAMMTHLPAFKNQLAQINEKDKWQFSQMEKYNLEASKRNQSSGVSDNQQKALNETLKKEGEKLSGLMEKVKQAKQDLQL